MVTVVTDSPVITLEGVAITLTFTVTDSLPLVVLTAGNWMFVDASGSHTIAPEDPRFTFSDDFLSLTIDPVHEEDEGTYTLTARNDAGLMDSASIEVDVQCKCVFCFWFHNKLNVKLDFSLPPPPLILVIPDITTPPVDINTYVGEDSTFTCAASGEPTPNITWTFNGSQLTTSEKYTVNGGLLTVHNVTGYDEGFYVCVATNVHGNDTAQGFLQPLCEFQKTRRFVTSYSNALCRQSFYFEILNAL